MASPIKYTLLAEAIRTAGLTFQSVAYQIGMSKHVFSQRMHGVTGWTLKEVYAVLHVLNLSPRVIGSLFPEDGDQTDG